MRMADLFPPLLLLPEKGQFDELSECKLVGRAERIGSRILSVLIWVKVSTAMNSKFLIRGMSVVNR